MNILSNFQEIDYALRLLSLVASIERNSSELLTIVINMIAVNPKPIVNVNAIKFISVNLWIAKVATHKAITRTKNPATTTDMANPVDFDLS
jgi:hypothetical protein